MAPSAGFGCFTCFAPKPAATHKASPLRNGGSLQQESRDSPLKQTAVVAEAGQPQGSSTEAGAKTTVQIVDNGAIQRQEAGKHPLAAISLASEDFQACSDTDDHWHDACSVASGFSLASSNYQSVAGWSSFTKHGDDLRESASAVVGQVPGTPQQRAYPHMHPEVHATAEEAPAARNVYKLESLASGHAASTSHAAEALAVVTTDAVAAKAKAGSGPALVGAVTSARAEAEPAAGNTSRAVVAPAPRRAPSHSLDPSVLDQQQLLELVEDLWCRKAQPCKACQAVLSWCKAQGCQPEQLGRDVAQHSGQVDLDALTQTAKRLQSSYADMESDDGWQVVLDGELKMMYRHMPGTTMHAFRARCTFDTPVENLLALAREIDLVPTWNKYCTSATVLEPGKVPTPATHDPNVCLTAPSTTQGSAPAKPADNNSQTPHSREPVVQTVAVPPPKQQEHAEQAASSGSAPSASVVASGGGVVRPMSPTELLAYMVMWMPWPFNNVAFTVHAQGAELLDEHDAVAIAFETPDKLPAEYSLPAGHTRHRKIHIAAPSGMVFKPLPPAGARTTQRTHAVMQVYADPSIKVPAFVISFVLKIMSPFVYSTVKRLLASAFSQPDRPLVQRIKARPELYAMLHTRVKQYLADKAADKAAKQAVTAKEAATAAGGKTTLGSAAVEQSALAATSEIQVAA